MLFAVFIEFQAVDDVLPKDIATCSYGCHRIKIGICNPNRQGRVLLEHGLSAT
jgi:hypothetical protein